MTYYYGFNPSGGVHRYTETPETLEYFALDTMSWVPMDIEPYRGWIDWRDLSDMPPEVREVECMSWVIPDPESAVP